MTGYHLPGLAAKILLAGGVLARGRLRRLAGGILVAAYACVLGALLA